MTASPGMSGRPRSVSTTSNAWRSAASAASLPVAVATTSAPSDFSSIANTLRMSSASSTSRIRVDLNPLSSLCPMPGCLANECPRPRRCGRRGLDPPKRGWSTQSAVDTSLGRTPLYQAHVEAGARMVPFGGWDMPVQYTGIIEEHRTVRAAVGLFDVSHMGEFEVEGPNAVAVLQRLTTNDVAALEVGQVQYSLLCYPEGGIVDDLTLYRLAPDRFMLTVNAGNIDKDWQWVTTHGAGARWRNLSQDTGLVAVQGPKAETLVGRLASCDVKKISYYRFAEATVAG